MAGLALTLSSCSSGLGSEEVKDGIRKFHYDERIACADGSVECLEHRLANAYPVFDMSPEYISTLRKLGPYKSGSEPNLDTIDTDATWLYPILKCEEELGLLSKEIDFSKPLPGQTYVVQDNVEGSSFHMTYLDGKWYNFPSFCD
jgi:hypothetical protein